MVQNYKKVDKAKLCRNQDCITVYGETAKLINDVVAVTTVIIALILLYKALK